MTSWNDGEDEAQDVEPDDGPTSLRDSVGSAEPSPVTDAMITPRTSPRSVEPGEAGESACRICGEDNQAGATYCLGCGVRLTAPSLDQSAEPEPWVDDDDLEFDHDAGLLDLDDVTPAPGLPDDAEVAPAAPSTPVDRRLLARRVLGGVIALAVIFLLLITFLNGSGNDEAATTTTVPPDLAALDAYQTELAGIASTVASLEEAALEANAEWEDRTTDFDTTLAALSSIESQAAALPDLVSALAIPEAIGSATHIRIITSAETLAEAATEMVEGLRAPDAGELRQAALAKFDAAAVEFASLTRVVDQAVASIRSEPTE